MLADEKLPSEIDVPEEPLDPAAVARRTTKLSQEIGRRLTEARENRGLSERDLARLAHLHHVSVHRTCHGEGGNPGVGTIADLAKALGVSAHWLAFGHPGAAEIKEAIAALSPADRARLLKELKVDA